MSLPHTFRYLLTCLIRKVGSKINKSFGTERKNTLRSVWQRTWGREQEWNFCRSRSERVGAEEKEGEEENKGWNICQWTLRLRGTWHARSRAQARDWILLQAVLHLEKGRGGRIFNKLIVMRLKYLGLFLAQTGECLPAMQETRVWSLGWEDPLEKEMATHSSTLAWKIPWTEKPGKPYSPWGRKESDTTEWLHFHIFYI